MWSIGLILISCVLFIHLGLGETIEKVIRFRFVLLHYAKCLSFWVILTYALLFSELSVVESVCSAFVSAYLALWIDLGLYKLARIYENQYDEDVLASEEAEHNK